MVAVLCLGPAAAGAGPQGDEPPARAPWTGSELSEDVQRRLAERFAPTLVFHPLEDYFPTSPLFSVDAAPGDASADAVARLGTAASRREQYRLLTIDEKASIASVYYRAYPARRDSRDVVVLEYWLYYVQNTYRVRGGLLPFWVDSSHPNDLEHIHIVLYPTDARLALGEVWTSSHEGVVPANRYRYEDATVLPERGRYLVERGSHAMAPDIDGDGLFTPGVDGDSGHRMLWGIRDHGVSSMRYDSSYIDLRRVSASTVFAFSADPASAETRWSYRLVPVGEIGEAFAQLDLTTAERRGRFEVPRNWLRRVFGADNGSSGKLLVPPAAEPRSTSIGISSIESTERGFLLGGTFKFQEQGAFLGARYAHLHGIRYLPDVIVEVDGVWTTRQGYVTTQVLGSYPIDASTRVMAGRALVTDSWRFETRQWDWFAGVEFRLGRMRISAASRSWGPITNLSKEFRLAYFF